MPRLIPAAVVVLALLVGALPAAASPALKLDYDCYRSGQAGTGTVTDFDPNTDVTVLLGGRAIGTSQTDDQGAVSVDFNAPLLRAGQRRSSSRLTAQDENGLVAEDVFDVVPLTLSARPLRGSWRSRVMFTVNGFVERTSLYEHVVLRGREVTNVLFGTPRAPCGALARSVRRLPLRRPAPGLYTLQFDLDAVYSVDNSPALRSLVRVPR